MDCHKGGIVTKSFHHAPHMNSEPGWNFCSRTRYAHTHLLFFATQ